MYTISEVSKLIGVSRQSIYKKLDNPDLQEHLQEGDKGKMISEKGFRILKKSFKEYVDSQQATVNQQSTEDIKTDNLQTELTGEYIASLKSEIDHLKGIISNQGQQLIDMTRLLENSQVLLKQQQDRILLLESPKPQQNEGETEKLSVFGRLGRLFRN